MVDSESETARLLAEDEPGPVVTVNRSGASTFLLIGDHAGNAIPRRLGTLGLSAEDRDRHIGWDIGVRGLGERLADGLDATFIHQRYSRLVIDYNRDPCKRESIPEVSDGTAIPGNVALAPADRQARVDALHEPYQAAIAAELARRDAQGQRTTLVSLHSFTPALSGCEQRPWHVGILHAGHEDGFARRLMQALTARADLVVGDNEPYRMDVTDYTVPRHAFAARRPYVEIEVRQDLITAPEGQARWAAILKEELLAAEAAGRS